MAMTQTSLRSLISTFDIHSTIRWDFVLDKIAACLRSWVDYIIKRKQVSMTRKRRYGPELIKLFFMLNLTGHEISIAHKNSNTNK